MTVLQSDLALLAGVDFAAAGAVAGVAAAQTPLIVMTGVLGGMLAGAGFAGAGASADGRFTDGASGGELFSCAAAIPANIARSKTNRIIFRTSSRKFTASARKMETTPKS